jgi:isoquinoline 1-oxidoreductase beta subunit
LLAGTAGAGALLVGWSVLPQRSRIGVAAMLPSGDGGDVALNGWIKILPDGKVVLAMPRSEMGQGVHTALSQLAAEELDVPLAAVRIEQAGSDAIYGNVSRFIASLPLVHPSDEERTDGYGRVVQAGQWLAGKFGRELGINATGGSTSVSDLWLVVRTAAATARASMVGAASLRWRLPADELQVRDGTVTHASGRSTTYADLARHAASTPPGMVQLKPREKWRLIGAAAPRQDLDAKVNGSARYGIDVRLPGMLHAAMRMCPMLGGSPGRIDASKALARPGVQRVIVVPALAGSTAGFAVVGRSYWEALRGSEAVEVEWRPRPGGAIDSRRAREQIEQALESGEGTTFYWRGDVDRGEASAKRFVEATYGAPFLAHAAMEPMNCTAQVGPDGVHLWVSTQVPEMCRSVAARVADLPLEKVHVHVPYLGGGFGRRLEVDCAAQAVRVAMDCAGAPVQLVWPREEDMTHDFYRPMQSARLRAGLDEAGMPVSLTVHSAGDPITPAYLERTLPQLWPLASVPDKTRAEGLADLPYAIPHQRIRHAATRTGVPVGYWRSVGHSQNAFFSECFIDELAAAAGRDPLEFRRGLLRRAPRHLAVLEVAAQRSGWGQALPAGRARGVALHESFGTVVAQVAEVSLEKGVPHVHRVVCAVDCGTVVNPGIVAQQMEGSIVFGLTAALYGRIDIHDGMVQQRNFPDYPMLLLASTPRVETWIVPSERAPSGIGEPGVPVIAPAVANALFALTGRRLRSLPLVI